MPWSLGFALLAAAPEAVLALSVPVHDWDAEEVSKFFNKAGVKVDVRAIERVGLLGADLVGKTDIPHLEYAARAGKRNADRRVRVSKGREQGAKDCKRESEDSTQGCTT